MQVKHFLVHKNRRFVLFSNHYYLLTYLLTSWEAANYAATQEIPSNYKEPECTVFTRALHWSISWARSIQSISSHFIFLRSILILSAHLRLGLTSGLFLLAFPPISCMNSSSPHSCYMPCPSHPPWFDHCNYVWRWVQVMKLLIQ
jgi:hypothetical protein